MWKLRQSFFPRKQFGNGISPRLTFCAMIADEAFVAPAELYLPFPHQVSVFYPLITWALAVNNWRSLPFAVKQIFSGRKSSGVCGRTVLYCLIPIQVLWVRIRVFFSAAMTI